MRFGNAQELLWLFLPSIFGQVDLKVFRGAGTNIRGLSLTIRYFVNLTNSLISQEVEEEKTIET